MQFSVIYEVDVPRTESIRSYVPPRVSRLWDVTERNEQYEYGYLEGEWETGKHRKWCALLDEDQFEQFVSHTGLFAEQVETMGSLGAPGFGFGWAPAISFTNDNPRAVQCAYVTPAGSREKLQKYGS